MAHSKAYDRHPEHRLHFDDVPVSMSVYVGDQLIAETERGLNLHEGVYPTVVYVPREDVRMDLLEKSDHSTHCPFKGDACYFDVKAASGDGAGASQVAWSYEDPFDQMSSLANHLAFYPDRVRLESAAR